MQRMGTIVLYHTGIGRGEPVAVGAVAVKESDGNYIEKADLHPSSFTSSPSPILHSDHTITPTRTNISLNTPMPQIPITGLQETATKIYSRLDQACRQNNTWEILEIVMGQLVGNCPICYIKKNPDYRHEPIRCPRYINFNMAQVLDVVRKQVKYPRGYRRVMLFSCCGAAQSLHTFSHYSIRGLLNAL
ncbi:hypothetical protein BDZ91DRAFT_135678 [Kalaharituber pfeilii]|nr:hypothetical protein BDZ91DRAFT_135678 [Kalaharituber pfeilii]